MTMCTVCNEIYSGTKEEHKKRCILKDTKQEETNQQKTVKPESKTNIMSIQRQFNKELMSVLDTIISKYENHKISGMTTLLTLRGAAEMSNDINNTLHMDVIDMQSVEAAALFLVKR